MDTLSFVLGQLNLFPSRTNLSAGVLIIFRIKLAGDVLVPVGNSRSIDRTQTSSE